MRRARRAVSLLLFAGMCLGLLTGCQQSESGTLIGEGYVQFIVVRTWEEYQSFLSDPAQERFLKEGGRLPEGFVEYDRFAMLGRDKNGFGFFVGFRHLALESEKGRIVDDIDVYREKICPYAYDPKISHPSAAKLGNLAYQPKYEVISLNNVHYQYTSEGHLNYMTTIVGGYVISFSVDSGSNKELTFNDYAPEEENFVVRMLRGEDVSEELRTILKRHRDKKGKKRKCGLVFLLRCEAEGDLNDISAFGNPISGIQTLPGLI